MVIVALTLRTLGNSSKMLLYAANEGGRTVGVTGVGADGGTPSEQKKAEA
jgi:hypothetical protein